MTLLLLLAALSITWLPRLDGPLDLRWDGATYYVLGTSLAEGQGYRYLNEPGAIAAVVWPPLLPALVAAHQLLLGTADPVVVGQALRWSFLALWILYIAGAYIFVRSLTTRPLAIAATLLTGLHMSTIWLSDRLYADLPFALIVTAFMIVIGRRPRSHVAPWLLACAAYLLRTAGIALMAAWIADAVLGRQWRVASQRLVLAALPVLAWQAYILHVERDPSYDSPPYAYARADYALYNVSYTRNMMLRDPTRPELGRATMGELPARMAGNLKRTLLHLGEATSILEKDWITLMGAVKAHPLLSHVVPWRAIPVSLVFFGIVTTVGAIALVAAGQRLVALVLVPYLLLLSLLPTDYHWPRYLAGVAPLLGACLVSGLGAMQVTMKRAGVGVRAQSAFAAVALASAVALQTVNVAWYFTRDLRAVTHDWPGQTVRYRMFTYDATFAAFDAGVDWVNARGQRDDIVVSSMPHWVYLRTGLRAVMPPFESRVPLAANLLDSVGARFLIIDAVGFSPAETYAAPVARSHAGRWRLRLNESRGLTQVFESTEASDTAVMHATDTYEADGM